MPNHNPGNLHTPPQPPVGKRLPDPGKSDEREPAPRGQDDRNQVREPAEPARDDQNRGREERDARARHEARRTNDAGEEE